MNPCSRNKANYVLITINEYNGYEKAIEIIRNKSLLQVDKAQADDFGYITLSARQKDVYRSKVWKMKKRTPYSIKLPVNDIRMVILRDLKTHYGYIEYDDDNFEYLLNVREKWLTDKNVADYMSCQEEVELLKFNEGEFAFDLHSITANLGQGLYEIEYYATEPI